MESGKRGEVEEQEPMLGTSSEEPPQPQYAYPPQGQTFGGPAPPFGAPPPVYGAGGYPGYPPQYPPPQYPPPQYAPGEYPYAPGQGPPPKGRGGPTHGGTYPAGEAYYTHRGPGYDPEAGLAAGYAAEFANEKVRAAFMRKVLGIVFLQLAVTAAVGIVCAYVQPVKMYVQTNPWTFYLAWGLSFAIVVYMSCSESARRRYPQNLITLSLFTLCFAYLVGMVTSFVDTQIVVTALTITAAVVGLTALIATATDFDLTRHGGFLYVITLAFIVALLVGIFWVNDVFILAISVIGAILFSLYLLYDLQLVMGRGVVALSPDEYVFAAVNIYLDIINIFLNILNALQASQR